MDTSTNTCEAARPNPEIDGRHMFDISRFIRITWFRLALTILRPSHNFAAMLVEPLGGTIAIRGGMYG